MKSSFPLTSLALSLALFVSGCGGDSTTADGNDGTTTVAPTTAVTSAPPTTVPPTTTSPGKYPVSGSSVLTLDGLGAIKVGMSLDEVYAATGQRIIEESSSLAPSNVCSYGRLEGVANINFTLHDHHVGVIQVMGDNKTPFGFGVGSSVDDVRMQFKVRESSLGVVYEPQGYEGNRMYFFTDPNAPGKISSIAAGKSQIDYFVGCD